MIILLKPFRINSDRISCAILYSVSNCIVNVPGKLRVALQIPYLKGGATRQPVFLATSKAIYSGWVLSVHSGKCSPCSSTLPIGKITTVPSLAACAASFVLNSSSQRQVFFSVWHKCKSANALFLFCGKTRSYPGNGNS